MDEATAAIRACGVTRAVRIRVAYIRLNFRANSGACGAHRNFYNTGESVRPGLGSVDHRICQYRLISNKKVIILQNWSFVTSIDALSTDRSGFWVKGQYEAFWDSFFTSRLVCDCVFFSGARRLHRHRDIEYMHECVGLHFPERLYCASEFPEG